MGILGKLMDALKGYFTHFWQAVIAVFTAVEHEIMADALPILRQIAVNLQNEEPGLNAQDFIPRLVAAAIPVLENEGIVLLHTAISAVASTVAHDLQVPDETGNQGNVNAA